MKGIMKQLSALFIAYILCIPAVAFRQIDLIAFLCIIPLTFFINQISCLMPFQTNQTESAKKYLKNFKCVSREYSANFHHCNNFDIRKKIIISVIIIFFCYILLNALFPIISLKLIKLFLIFFIISIIVQKLSLNHYIPVIYITIISSAFIFIFILIEEIITKQINANLGNLFVFNATEMIINYLQEYFTRNALNLLRPGIISLIILPLITAPIYISKKLITKGNETKEEKFEYFNPNYNFIWLLILSTIIILISEMLVRKEILRIIGWNISLIILFTYFISGTSIFIYFTKKFFFPKILTFFIIILLSFIIILLNLVVKVIIITIPFAIGILDIWFDFRLLLNSENKLL